MPDKRQCVVWGVVHAQLQIESRRQSKQNKTQNKGQNLRLNATAITIKKWGIVWLCTCLI